MTLLAILALLSGILLISDGAFDRGLVVSFFPNPAFATIAVVRILEVIAGGMIFILLGLTASKC